MRRLLLLRRVDAPHQCPRVNKNEGDGGESSGDGGSRHWPTCSPLKVIASSIIAHVSTHSRVGVCNLETREDAVCKGGGHRASQQHSVLKCSKTNPPVHYPHHLAAWRMLTVMMAPKWIVGPSGPIASPEPTAST